jgi:hypothetical protein
LINVPTHTSENGLLATAGRKGEKWIEAIIRQVSENAEDGAQWICTYLGKWYDDAFKTAATQLGFPYFVRMDPYDFIAMFINANVTITQMKTIKQYLRRCLGNGVFISDYKVWAEFTKELVMPEYGSYSYLYKNARRRSAQNK